MTTRQITCISCPVGCLLSVEMNGREVVSVAGNACPRGVTYAKAECTDPRRMVTTTVKVRGGELSMLPVRTRTDIPKGLVKESVRALKGLVVDAPVRIGDVVLGNVCGTGVDFIATANVEKAIER